MRLAQTLCVIAVFSTGAAAFEPAHLIQLKDTIEYLTVIYQVQIYQV